MSEEELREHTRQMGVARQHRRRVAAEANEHNRGIAPNVSLADIVTVCKHAFGATFDAPGSDIHGQPDWSARLAAAATLVALFPRALRTTPQDAKALLRDVLADTEHEQLAERDPSEWYRALRREHFDACARYDDLRGLYAAEIPSWLVGPGETKAEIMRTEAPSFEDWTVRDIDTHLPGSHVLAVTPAGEEQLVPRESSYTFA